MPRSETRSVDRARRTAGERGQQDDRLDHRVVAAVDAVDRELPDAWPQEHGLGDECALDHRADLETDDRDRRDEAVLQGMAHDHVRLRQPFCARGAHVILAEHVQQARPDLPHVHGDAGGREGDRRQHEAAEIVERVVAELHIPARMGDPEDQPEDEDEDQAEEEVRERDAGERHPGREQIERRVMPHR